MWKSINLQALPNIYTRLTIFSVTRHVNVNKSKTIEASRPSIDTHLVSTLTITTPNGIGIKPIRLATKSE